MKIFAKLIIISALSVFSLSAFAQADTITKVCEQHLSVPYVSDGQQYRTLLNGDETAEFRTFFYAGSQYRIVGCSGLEDGNLIFKLYDQDRNLIFTNEDYENAPYWDFKFNSSMECTVEAVLDSKNAQSGFATLLIGFKQ